jgi:hypothetical protein
MANNNYSKEREERFLEATRNLEFLPPEMQPEFIELLLKSSKLNIDDGFFGAAKAHLDMARHNAERLGMDLYVAKIDEYAGLMFEKEHTALYDLFNLDASGME